MAKNNQIKKDRSAQVFFILFLCIIAFRLSFTENSAIESFSLQGVFYDNFISICISAILLLSAGIWLAVTFCSHSYRYKYSGFEFGAFLFIIAAVVSTYFASNRRAAMNDSLAIIAIIFSAIALCRILDSETRRKILLFAVIAMGIVNVYQCTEQFFSSNKVMIEQYETEPEFQLERLGIEPGSFQNMLYEHRLYSKDVKGFFSTSNSAGSLFNLAIFSALAVFGPGLKRFRKNPFKVFILPITILLILFLGLLLTASKGALISFVLALFILLISTGLADFLRAHKIFIFSVAAAGFIAGISLIVSYGLKHNTLPGGNSMLVRWQYWTASAAMITDHFFTGVGGSNFGSFYTHYKIPEALETVRDPHCFVLNILCSYGIIGLAGFCCGLFVPFIRAIKNLKISPPENKNNLPALARSCGIFAVLTLLFLRPLAIRTGFSTDIAVAIYIFAIMYAAPVFLFGTTLWLCVRNRKSYDEFPIWTAPLLCGIFAVLLHNLIDFAIFEPGIMTALWALVAVVASQSLNNRSADKIKVNLPLFKITASAAVIAVLTAALLHFYIIPVGKTAAKIETAKLLSAHGNFNTASAILASAVADDSLNPTPPAMNGITLLYRFNSDMTQNQDALFQAEKAFQTAIQRDPADFKNYEKLAQVYQMLADEYPQQRPAFLEKVFDTLNRAVNLYPGSADLHLTLADTAQQLGKIDYAVEHYSQAVAIEDAYRQQFKIMYPGREVFSRLGEIKYRFAKDRLEQLTQKKEK
ncbi:MAG: O-antigen ligase family protein [Planctomycetes bacterium]|nr:O-antigen ligase family protein [Planctomycetota bacterium]